MPEPVGRSGWTKEGEVPAGWEVRFASRRLMRKWQTRIDAILPADVER